jgi:hypothetical protein
VAAPARADRAERGALGARGTRVVVVHPTPGDLEAIGAEAMSAAGAQAVVAGRERGARLAAVLL